VLDSPLASPSSRLVSVLDTSPTCSPNDPPSALHLGYVCFLEFTFWKITFQTFLCLFAIKKVHQRKTLSSERKI
jgi:hypothetical protein